MKLLRLSCSPHRYVLFNGSCPRTLATHRDDLFHWASSLLGLGGGLSACGGGAPQALARVIASFLLTLTLAQSAYALPSGWSVESGDVRFDVADGGATLNVISSQPHAVINWQSFNVQQGETVNFLLPSAMSSVLNRILGGASTINGALNSNGTVILSNPAGIAFGSAAQINVGSLIASTLHLSTANYLADDWTFSRPDGVAASLIDNRGNITAQPGGFVVLAGGAVRNTGNIFAPEGHIDLAVGDVVRMQVSPSQSVEVTIDEAVKTQIDGIQAAIDNRGTLSAQEVRLRAKLIEALYAQSVHHAGIIHATTAKVSETGHISLRAEGADASIVVSQSGQLLANAAADGNGGVITVLADGHTQFDGVAEAKGGSHAGDGGFIETSGVKTLRIGQSARVDASATNGAGGEWLMDPTDMTIHAGAGADDASNVYAQNIQNTLNTGTSVTVQTAAAGGAAGDLNVSAGTTISKTSGGDATLTLKAHNSILMNGAAGNGVSISASSGKLHVVLNSDTDQGADGGLGGAIKLNYANITSNGGNITLGGGANPATQAATGTAANIDGVSLNNGSTLNAGAGDISIRGQGRNGAGVNYQTGVSVLTGGKVQTTSGNINVSGVGGNGAQWNMGVYVNGAGSEIATQSGAIAITGQGGVGSNVSNQGVYISTGGKVESTGSGTIAITGTGGASSNSSHGVYLNAGTIRSQDGNIQITATGGVTPDRSGNGLYMLNTGRIESLGNANITITASGNASNGGTGANIRDVNTRIISQGAGNITLNATGGSNGASNHGVLVYTGAQIVSAGSGTLNITGTGHGTTSTSYGVYITGADAKITSATGAVTVTGQGGGGNSTGNMGVYLLNGGQVTSTGSATVNVSGTGGTGTTLNVGVQVEGANSLISGVSGAITVTGQGGTGSAERQYGVYLYNGGQVTSTGSAAVNVSGTGGTGTFRNDGVRLYGASTGIYGVDGAITVNAQAGSGSSNYQMGLVLHSGAQIQNVGLGAVTVTATGGAGTTDNYGIYSDGAGSGIFGHHGDVSVTAQGGAGSGDNNHGFYLQNAGTVATDGSGDVTITAIKGSNASTSFKTASTLNMIGSNSMTGDLTIRADDFSLVNLALKNNGGEITLAPQSAGTTIGLNGGAGALQLTNAMLTMIDTSVAHPAQVTLGDVNAGTGLVTIADNWNLSAYNFNVRAAGGSIQTGGVTSGAHNLTMVARTGSIAATGVISAADLSLSTLSNGNISLANNLTASGTLALNLNGAGALTQTGGVLSGATVSLASGSGNLGSALSALQTSATALSANTTGSAWLNETNDVTLNASTVGGTLSLSAGGDIATGGASSANVLSLSAGGADGDIALGHNLNGATSLTLAASGTGDITQTAGVLSGGTINLSSGSGNLGSALTALQTDAAAVSANTTGSAWLNEASDVTLNASTVSGTLSLSAGGDIATGGASSANVLSLSAGGADGDITLGHNLNGATSLTLAAAGTGDITQTAGTLTAPALTLSAASGNMGSALNALQTSAATVTVNATTGSAWLNDADDVTLNASTAGATLSLSAGGDIATGGVSSANVLSLSAGGADGDLAIGHHLSGTTSLNLAASGTGDITQTAGVLSGGTINLSSGSGNLGSALTALQTDAAAVSANTTGSAWLNEANDATVNASTVGGTLSLSAGGDIATGGALSADILTLSAGGADGDIALAYDASGATSLTLTASGTGDITQSGGVLSGASLHLSSGSGNLGSALAALHTNAGTMAVNTTGSAWLSEANALTLNASTVGGTFSLSAGGDLTLAGLLTAQEATLSSGGSIVDGNGAANNLLTTGDASLSADNIIGQLFDPLEVVVGGRLTLHMHGSYLGYGAVVTGAVGSLSVLLPDVQELPGYYYEGLKNVGQQRVTPAASGNVLFNNSLLLGQVVETVSPEISFLLQDKQAAGVSDGVHALLVREEEPSAAPALPMIVIDMQDMPASMQRQSLAQDDDHLDLVGCRRGRHALSMAPARGLRLGMR